MPKWRVGMSELDTDTWQNSETWGGNSRSFTFKPPFLLFFGGDVVCFCWFEVFIRCLVQQDVGSSEVSEARTGD